MFCFVFPIKDSDMLNEIYALFMVCVCIGVYTLDINLFYRFIYFAYNYLK